MAGLKEELSAILQQMTEDYCRGDYDKMTSHYTDDCSLFVGGRERTHGREAAKETMQWFGSVIARSQCSQVLECISCSEVFAWTTNDMIGFDSAGNAKMNIKNNLLWKKVDGKWLIHKDISNDNPKQ